MTLFLSWIDQYVETYVVVELVFGLLFISQMLCLFASLSIFRINVRGLYDFIKLNQLTNRLVTISVDFQCDPNLGMLYVQSFRCYP